MPTYLETPPPIEPNARPEKVSWLGRLRNWLRAHHMTLLAINDTPHSIALGSAIGIFFGFTPLLSLKTLLSIAVAWLCKSNKLAAAIAVTLHDVLLLAMPAIYLLEYKIGMFILHGRVPARTGFRHTPFLEHLHWKSFLSIGLPTFIGSIFVALPSAILVYFFLRRVIMRARAGSPLAAQPGSVREIS
ncbi:MAG: DUF2062 domain-containing protein [Verrucomicrobiota bacterium]|nr:DUF2062 domain-containing protein [Verrucomicrobiota bacterium]